MLDPIALAIPFFLLFIGVELAWAKRRGVVVYRFTDSITNLSCGISSQVMLLLWASAQLVLYEWTFRHRLVDLPAPWVTWVVAFVGVDFAYYWWHRLSHEVNVLWAAHVVHHQSEDYNLAVALRQSVLTTWTVFPFYLPLALLGVPTAVFALTVAVSTLYQFWIHTQLVPKIRGPIDWVFNLPSHHRVHHAINEQYLDKNYGATLVVWDRLFGTYAEEVEVPVYGITKPLGTFDPLWAQVHYWFEMAAMARAAPPGEKLRVWLASPAWKPTGYTVDVAPVEGRLKYDRPISRGLTFYVGLHYLVLIAATFGLLLRHGSMGTVPLVLGGGAVLLALVAFGAFFENRRWAKAAEGARLALGVAALAALVL